MWWVDMFHAADQMAAMKTCSVVLPFASVSIEMEKKFQGVENLRTVLQTVVNLVCLLFHERTLLYFRNSCSNKLWTLPVYKSTRNGVFMLLQRIG